MSEEEFALKASSEVPWWAKAPIWLSLGIIGVPSLMAIGAGYFIAQSVTRQLRALEQYNLSEMHQLNNLDTDQRRRWEAISRLMQLSLQTQRQTCLHEAQTPQQRDECVASVADHLRELQKLR
jgi:hypothetical protein